MVSRYQTKPSKFPPYAETHFEVSSSETAANRQHFLRRGLFTQATKVSTKLAS